MHRATEKRSFPSGWPARVRRAWGLILAAAVILLAQAADARQEQWPTLSLPESMQVQIVSEGMRVNGMSTRIYEFRSSESIEDLTAHFDGIWDGSMARSRVEPWDVLAHRDRDHLITVQMRSGRLNDTSGYIAFSNAFELMEHPPRPRKVDMPMLPGSQLLQDIEADDLGRRSRTLVILSDQSASQNLEFYRAHFEQERYEPVSHGALAKDERGGAMILNRGAEQLNVAIAERKGWTVITIVSVRQ